MTEPTEHPARAASIVDLTANVLLFLPWGALVAIGLDNGLVHELGKACRTTRLRGRAG